MIKYIVTQEGVYRHCIKGVYDTIEAAKSCALDCASDYEDDGYHSYDVSSLNLNEACEDVSLLYSYQKGCRYSEQPGVIKVKKVVGEELVDEQ